jgi:hypothetical protein
LEAAGVIFYARTDMPACGRYTVARIMAEA